MRKIFLFTSIFSCVKFYAFNYRPEIDGEGGLFFIRGSDAIFGIVMLIGCVALSSASYYVADLIEKKKNPQKGVLKFIVTLLYIIACVACIAAIGFAFTLWWIVLIVLIVFALGYAIYERNKSN